jgi:protein O-GlcNAc transferase
MKNEWRKALPYAWKAVELKKSFKEAIDLVGSIFLKMEDYENSIRSFQKVIAIDPKDAIGFYNLGCAYSADKQFQAAEDSWRRALRLDSSFAEKEEKPSPTGLLTETIVVETRQVSFNCHLALGEMLANQDRIQEAMMQYQAARVLETRNADVYFEIGKLYLKMENPEKAKESFEAYLSLGGEKEEEANRILESIKKQE